MTVCTRHSIDKEITIKKKYNTSILQGRHKKTDTSTKGKAATGKHYPCV